MEKVNEIMLGLKRNLHSIITGTAACGLLVVGVADLCFLGFGEGMRIAGVAVSSVFCIVGAAAIVCLGRRWLRLSGEIESIVRRLKTDKASRIKPTKSAIINELIEIINEQFDSYATIAELEKQIEAMGIQIRLSQGQKTNTESIIYSIRDAVIVVDEFDKLSMANEASEKFFGFKLGDSQHKPISEIIGQDKSAFVEYLRQSRKSRVRHARKEMEFPSDSEVKTLDCIVSCVYDQRDEVCGAVAVLHDITREKEISKMKNDFVSHVSHELKTPLSSITAYSEMLMDGEADDEKTRKEFYSVIQSQAKRLNRLIEDILNISRIESGLIKVNKEPLSLTMLIEEQMKMIKGFAEEKNIEVSCRKLIVFDQVYGDRDMISQVIVNLLSNAVKYTPSGGSVKIGTEVDETAQIARVTVTDTGVGIPAGEVDHVFDKFYRVGANKKCAKGTGLGLNLVKQMVEKVHSGRVFVTSEVGVGSTFGFELPLATPEAVEAGAAK